MSAKKLPKKSIEMILIHPTAEVNSGAKIGFGTKIWNHVQIREKAIIGKNCVLGKGVYVDCNVVMGNNVHVQNYSCIYDGVIIENSVFIGPGVMFATDRYPRSLTDLERSKKRADWVAIPIYIQEGATIGAGAVILGGVRIGKFAMVGAGAVVTKDVSDHGLVAGNPARIVGFVCKCGYRAQFDRVAGLNVRLVCSKCKSKFRILRACWDKFAFDEST